MMRIALLVLAVTLAPIGAIAKGCRRAQGVAAGEAAPCAGVVLPIEAAKRCARSVVDLRRCRDDLHEAQRRAALPLPRLCTPTVVTKTIERPRPLWVVPVSVVVGLIVGAWATREVMK